MTGAPLALAWNRGERMIRLPPLPTSPALLVIPDVPIATPEAFSWIDQSRTSGTRRGAVALDLAALSQWGDIGRMAGNDFESAVFGRHSQIRAAFEALAATKPLVCRMSGSGSTLFGIYRSARDREDALMMLGRKHGTLVPVETMATPAPGPIPAT
jgi:4-diphosphocytidyl-2-C-methyl-D-erythritol kinase